MSYTIFCLTITDDIINNKCYSEIDRILHNVYHFFMEPILSLDSLYEGLKFLHGFEPPGPN